MRPLIVATILAVAAAHCARNAPSPACGIRFAIPPPADTRFSRLQIPAVSPDGAAVAFMAAGSDGVTHVWVHSLRRSVARRVPGTEGGSFPFWSPDGASIGFFAGDRLKRVDIASGAVHVLAEAKDGRGGAWSPWGIVFSAASGAASRAIFALPASGGAIQQRTNLANDPEEGHFWPAFLPDAEHFVYSATRGPRQSTFLGSVRATERIPFLGGGSPIAAVGRHSLLVAGDEALLKYAFNEKLLTADGPAELVAPAVARGPSGLASFGASADGSAVVYQRSGAEVIWLGEDGKESAAIPDAGYLSPRLSPSGDEILVSIGAGFLGKGAGRYYVYETKTDRWRRIVDGVAGQRPALWSADGSEIVLTAVDEDEKAARVLAVRADGSGVIRKLLDVEAGSYAAAISRTGNLLAIVEPAPGPGKHLSIRVVTLGDGRRMEEATVWRATGASDSTRPALSPDGRWLAYVSNQSGQEEVYVSAVSGGGAPWQISSNGGSYPAWTADGRRLFFRGSSGLHAVATDGPPETWVTRGRLVFRHEDLRDRLDDLSEFDITPDGSRALLSRRPDPDRPAELVALVSCAAGRGPVVVP